MGANLTSSSGILRRGKRRRSRLMAEINVTPFVDVMLVLLIVFMVSAPMLTVGVPIELPKTTANALPTEREEPLTITLMATVQIFIQKTETTVEELITKLSAIAQERSGDRIFLRADGAIPYEGVVKVMGLLNEGGFTNIALVTDVTGPSYMLSDG